MISFDKQLGVEAAVYVHHSEALQIRKHVSCSRERKEGGDSRESEEASKHCPHACEHHQEEDLHQLKWFPSDYSLDWTAADRKGYNLTIPLEFCAP